MSRDGHRYFFQLLLFFLSVCGRRYKNGPGLKYHYTHYNHEQEAAAGPAPHHEEPPISHPSTPSTASVPVESPKVPPSPPHQRGPGRPKKVPGSGTSPNNYCDFCLGDVYENKTTGFPEELLSCADCGRSGITHFSLRIISNKYELCKSAPCFSFFLCGMKAGNPMLVRCACLARSSNQSECRICFILPLNATSFTMIRRVDAWITQLSGNLGNHKHLKCI